MSDSNLFNTEIIQKIKSAGEAKIIQPVQVGQTPRQNELVFFVKPELLDVVDNEKILNSLQLIEQKFIEYDIEVKGAAIIPGNILEEFEIMNRHYGFINQLSRFASTMIDADTRSRIFEMLDQEDTGDHKILGGHEFLKTFDTDVDTLSDVWFAQEANKLRSGFYFIEDTFQGKPVVLVNGFHPSQLQHFTQKDHRIYLMLLHTDTDWMAMKFDLVGETFPERAKPGSIRGLLYANPKKFGQEEVGINTNGVHLSAGPFEAAFEVVNFLGAILELDPEKTPPLAIEQSMKAGFSQEQAIDLLKNPAVNDSDLFSETENMNTDDAIKLARDLLAE